jgi:uncharacterized protein (DUF433 family)
LHPVAAAFTLYAILPQESAKPESMPPSTLDDAMRQLIQRYVVLRDGRPTLSSSGRPVEDLLRDLSGGMSESALIAAHTGLSSSELRACMAYAAEAVAEADLKELLAADPGCEPATLPPPSPHEAATLPPVPPKAVDSPAPGGTLAGYELLGELGRGGMGVVYKAKHLALKRLVALKMILAGEYAGAETLARFRAEAEAVAALQHPGIVQIFEVGEHDGRAFFALEYCDGGSLARRLDAKPWPVRKAAELVAELAGAVHAAHEGGVVHRDLKPDNVLLTGDGLVKIGDFGLAKRLEAGEGNTRTGEIMGTPSYMAPEQAAGRAKEVGRAADVYSLGAILYRLLAGRPPFAGATTLDVLAQVLSDEPPPLRRINRAVPRDLETIVSHCLEKDPAKRYETAMQLQSDLELWLQGKPIVARGTRWRTLGRALERPEAVTGVPVRWIADGLLAGFAVGAFFLGWLPVTLVGLFLALWCGVTYACSRGDRVALWLAWVSSLVLSACSWLLWAQLTRAAPESNVARTTTGLPTASWVTLFRFITAPEFNVARMTTGLAIASWLTLYYSFVVRAALRRRGDAPGHVVLLSAITGSAVGAFLGDFVVSRLFIGSYLSIFMKPGSPLQLVANIAAWLLVAVCFVFGSVGGATQGIRSYQAHIRTRVSRLFKT